MNAQAMTAGPALLQSNWPGQIPRRGKVRDVYGLGDRVLIVATDRISAFDVVMASGVPGKGRILTGISRFWFERFCGRIAHHVISMDLPASAPSAFAGRSMLCRRAEVIPIECVVRGYLAGSGWKEYRESGRVCGVALPTGLRMCERLPEPIFTPATKAESGHDENVSFEQAAALVGGEVMATLREKSIWLYQQAAAHAESCGILLADTKFEFGYAVDCGREIMLIDEVLTPDSSRFWPAEGYAPGHDQPSFDKQFVRNYLEGLVAAGKWDKRPPGVELPADVIAGTQQRYLEAYRRLVGDGAAG